MTEWRGDVEWRRRSGEKGNMRAEEVEGTGIGISRSGVFLGKATSG